MVVTKSLTSFSLSILEYLKQIRFRMITAVRLSHEECVVSKVQ